MWLAVLTSAAIVCLITACLTVLLLIAKETIANYGPCTITINEGRTFTVQGGGTLLQALKQGGVFIPSACGGRGSCGFCKVRVKRPRPPILPTEIPWLSKQETADNVRLSCQFKVKQDMALHIPQSLLAIKEYTTRAAAMENLTHDIKQVLLELVDPAQIDFRAGQYIQMEVPANDLSAEPVYRAYSIASSPSDTGRLELEIRKVAKGIATTYVHETLQPGDTVRINGPYGSFYVRDTDRDIIFIAGGSGMAPIKSMLLDLAEKRSTRGIRYFFGARGTEDLFLLSLMQELQQQLPGFVFIPALSHPDPKDNWTGEKGLITEVVGRQLTDNTAAEAYLCGSPGMIKACVAVLTGKGIPAERIFYDSFS